MLVTSKTASVHASVSGPGAAPGWTRGQTTTVGGVQDGETRTENRGWEGSRTSERRPAWCSLDHARDPWPGTRRRLGGTPRGSVGKPGPGGAHGDGSSGAGRAPAVAAAVEQARTSVSTKEDQLNRLVAELERMRRQRLLPDGGTLQKLVRYEAHLNRQLYQALHELEALQARRQGEPAPLARVDVQGMPAS